MIDLIERKQYWRITPEIIDRVIAAIRDGFKPEKIVLFGSAVTGRLRPDSDLDLLVVMETDLPPYKRATPIRMHLRPSPCPMDVLVFTPAEIEEWNGMPGHIITEAFKTGRVMYDRC